jgi:hypothetical protein
MMGAALPLLPAEYTVTLGLNVNLPLPEKITPPLLAT